MTNLIYITILLLFIDFKELIFFANNWNKKILSKLFCDLMAKLQEFFEQNFVSLKMVQSLMC